MLCSVQSIDKDGKLIKPQLQVWRAKTRKEFDDVKKLAKRGAKLADVVWMKAEDYSSR